MLLNASKTHTRQSDYALMCLASTLIVARLLGDIVTSPNGDARMPAVYRNVYYSPFGRMTLKINVKRLSRLMLAIQ